MKSACQFRRLKPSFVGAISSALPSSGTHAVSQSTIQTRGQTTGTLYRTDYSSAPTVGSGPPNTREPKKRHEENAFVPNCRNPPRTLYQSGCNACTQLISPIH